MNIDVMDAPEIIAVYQKKVPLFADFEEDCWRQAAPLTINQNWRGENAPADLHTTALTLWTDSHLYFGFECGYFELDVDTEYDVERERYALWDRDVCEAFIRSPREPNDRVYKEFEVAPTGQWCDLKVDRNTLTADWEWKSGMKTARAMDPQRGVWRVLMALPFAAFGVQPQAGDVWRANLFRISRARGERQYLALSPTRTAIPNFHVPECFVPLRFAASPTDS